MELLDWIVQKDHLLAILILGIGITSAVVAIIRAARGRDE